MSLAPLLDAAPAIPLHAFAAMAAFALGVVQFAAPKGTLPHRTLGWIWVAVMAVVLEGLLHRRKRCTIAECSGPSDWNSVASSFVTRCFSLADAIPHRRSLQLSTTL